MAFEIKNKVALVTGGGCGLGLNIAKEIIRNGAKVMLQFHSIAANFYNSGR